MHDPADVLLGFGVGRNAVVAINGTFAGVVGGCNQAPVTGKTLVQPADIGQRTLDVLLGVKRGSMLFFAATLRIRLAIRCFAKGCLLR